MIIKNKFYKYTCRENNSQTRLIRIFGVWISFLGVWISFWGDFAIRFWEDFTLAKSRFFLPLQVWRGDIQTWKV